MQRPSVEGARLRNLQRFYTTDRRDSKSSQASSRSGLNPEYTAVPDSALVAFLQLVALRLSKQRALISLVDEDQQFFIAEGTGTDDLLDSKRFHSTDDVQWMGCWGSTTREEALCTHTMAAEENPGGYSSFIVTDLQKDSRFAHLSYVAEQPHFRFYAGVPLISAAGFRVGSLFVIDTRPAPTLSEAEIVLMGTMAVNVMRYLDFQAEYRQSERTVSMARALAALVARDDSSIHSKSDKQAHMLAGSAVEDAVPNEHRRDSSSSSISSERSEPLIHVDMPEKTETLDQLYARATDLLRQALEVEYVAFIETKKYDTTSMNEPPPAYLRAASTSPLVIVEPGFDLHADRAFFESVCDLFPKGKLWYFKADGSLKFEDDQTDDVVDSDDFHSRRTKRDNMKAKAVIAKALLIRFPLAQQILFIPFYTEGSFYHNTMCFAVKHDDLPILSSESEISYMRSFVNSLTVLHDRLRIKESEAQKTHFISSISHELRSPLHGIVATTEILAETNMTETQRGMCQTLDICAQTLIDTITQILDFNKINDFLLKDEPQVPIGNQQTRALRRPSRPPSNTITTIHRGSSLHSVSTCDIGALGEEVMTISTISRARLASVQVNEGLLVSAAGSGEDKSRPAVDVDLSIAVQDWRFLCSPGAIRRILMNLVDNSFKYTRNGMIRVSLDLVPVSTVSSGTEKVGDRTLLLRVMDTGIGMSAAYLKKGLFVPFSQVSTVSPGSGLGLSLVRNIVESLEGKIDVQSTLGQGTEILVSIPLQRPPTWEPAQEIQPLHVVAEAAAPDVSLTPEKHVINTFSLLDSGNSLDAVKESVRHYMCGWFGFREVDPQDSPHIVFMSATDPAFSRWRANIEGHRSQAQSGLIVLYREEPVSPLKLIHCQELVFPIGPVKLRRSIQTLIRQSAATETRSVDMKDFADTAAEQVTEVNEDKSLLTAGPMSDNVTIDLSLSQLNLTNNQSLQGSETEAPRRLPGLSTRNSYMEAIGVDSNAIDAATTTSTPSELDELSAAENGGESLGGSVKVLCVDDNAINLKLLVTYSKKVGFKHIEGAEDGLQALRKFEGSIGGHDVIFMDLTMPICDGFRSTTMIREHEAKQNALQDLSTISRNRRRHAMIIALTGLASAVDQEKAFAAGVDHFVTKPLRFRDFRAMLQTCGILNENYMVDSTWRPGVVAGSEGT